MDSDNNYTDLTKPLLSAGSNTLKNIAKKIDAEDILKLQQQTYTTLVIFNIIKIVITIAILSWTIYISYQINYDPVTYEKYAKIHSIWFGTSSPLFIIATLWMFSLMIFFIIPFVKTIYNILLRATNFPEVVQQYF